MLMAMSAQFHVGQPIDRLDDDLDAFALFAHSTNSGKLP